MVMSPDYMFPGQRNRSALEDDWEIYPRLPDTMGVTELGPNDALRRCIEFEWDWGTSSKSSSELPANPPLWAR